MTIHSFLIALGIGAALIAFWFAIRFPDRAPENLQRLLIHVAVVLAAGWLAPTLTAPLISAGFPTMMAALFAVALPVLIYTFLAGAWVLQLLHQTFSRYRR
jgi:pimeloyl-ACP methyl ester carboxylesterase